VWRAKLIVSLTRRLLMLSTARQLRIMEIPPEQPPVSAEEFARLIETAQKYVDPLSPEAFGLALKSPRKVQIKHGPRRGQWSTVSSGKATDKFEAAWQIYSGPLKAAGYRYEEYRGRWRVSYFQDLPEQPGGTKPTPIPPNFNNIPAELTERRNWVLWCYEPPKRSDKKKWEKVPYQPDGERADTTKAQTWSTFAAACAGYTPEEYDGIGFIFDGVTGPDGLCTAGIDLGVCRTCRRGMDKTSRRCRRQRARQQAQADP
jgi:hypothetical protein